MSESTSKDSGVLRCSFCGKTQDEVRKLIAGPTVYICNECVELCTDIIEEEWEREESERISRDLLKPEQIKAALPEGYQQVVHLHYSQGHTCAEIGQILGLKVGSVTSRLTRARQMLRKLLSDEQGNA